jgi:hypothetical protein
MDKRGIWQDELGWWIIGLVILVISLIAYGAYSGKLQGFLQYIEDLFRFGP